ncbi:MAG: glycerophosphodiester phosphodiesterase [Chloroflexota bacterium]|nr:glycerophosphodiester phosphodiesterase [Chloroflexota bacterium]
MGHAPENTIASFEAAIALECDEVDTDVWSRPEGLVIRHDPPGPSDDGTPALTLDEVLEYCRGRVAVNVELKCRGSEEKAAETGRRVATRLAERGGDEAYVSSFWWPALAAAAEAAPAVRRAFIFASYPPLDALLSAGAGIGLWALHPRVDYATTGLVRRAHEAGLRVNAWTANDPRDIAALVAAGVDGIASDYPERVPKG